MMHMNESSMVMEAADAFLAALVSADWPGAVGLMCPPAVENIAEGWRNQVRMPPRRSMSAEEYRASNPGMPEAVAQHWAEEAKRVERESAEWWRNDLPGTDSGEEVLQASAEVLMARYLSTWGRANMGDGWTIEWSVLGAVLDGPKDAYVVYRRHGGRHRDADGRVREFQAPAELLPMSLCEGRWCVSYPHVVHRSGGAWIIVGEAEEDGAPA